MIDGKPRVQIKAQTITKDKFPSLLKTLYTYIYSSGQGISSNLVKFLTISFDPILLCTPPYIKYDKCLRKNAFNTIYTNY